MTNLTNNEFATLNWIAYNEMTPLNGDEPFSYEDCQCFMWVDELAPNLDMTIEQTKGVVGSLVKKGFIYSENDGEDDVCGFTEAGWVAWIKGKKDFNNGEIMRWSYGNGQEQFSITDEGLSGKKYFLGYMFNGYQTHGITINLSGLKKLHEFLGEVIKRLEVFEK